MEGFTPILSTIGGVLIGFAAVALLYFNGRIAGVSGIMGVVLRPKKGDTLWRVVFLGGLVAGALLLAWLHPAALALRFDVNDSTILLGGFLGVAGDWDPSLALVMLGSAGVYMMFYRWIQTPPGTHRQERLVSAPSSPSCRLAGQSFTGC